MITSIFRTISLSIILFYSCQAPDNSNSGWQKVYQNDPNGKSIFGDKAELIDAVRLGYPIRIGWGSNRVEHVANADFLTIFQGEEVFAQSKTIIGQAPKIEGDSLKIGFRTQNHWTKIAGSNGYSTSVMSNYIQDSVVSPSRDRYTSTTWYVLYPAHQLDIEPKPLWRKGSPNWEKWKSDE